MKAADIKHGGAVLGWFLACGFNLLPVLGWAQSAAPGSGPSEAQRVHLIGGAENCISRVRVGEKLVFGYENLLPHQGTLTTNGVRLTVKEKGRSWVI